MSHRFHPAIHLAALALAAACSVPAVAGGPVDPLDLAVDPLDLPVDEPAAVGVAAPTRISVEAAAGRATRRGAQDGQTGRGIARLALDARHARGLGDILPVGGGTPIKGHFYSDSGRRLETVFYRRFKTHLGAQRPTEMVIIDGVDAQSVTVMRLSDWRAREIPATWFQREFLPRYQAGPRSGPVKPDNARYERCRILR